MTFQPGNTLGGRKPGIPNKSAGELKALAREHGPEAVGKLAKLMRGKDTATAKLIAKLTDAPIECPKTKALVEQLLFKLNERKPDNELGAARELLDRGYGKAAQPLTGEDGEGPAKILIERHIIDPKVIEGEVINGDEQPEFPIIHVMRHPTVEEATVEPLPEGAPPKDQNGSGT